LLKKKSGRVENAAHYRAQRAGEQAAREISFL
jgi:hypothetical protein